MNGTLHHGDCLAVLPALPDRAYQVIVADPPYFQVMLDEAWDNQWKTEEEYLVWFEKWVEAAMPKLRDDGLLFVFGQLGKREHIWLHVSSRLTQRWQFHDMIIWDRAVGYNERYDSFTPCYEMVLVLRKTKDATPYFNKDAVRLPYDEPTIQTYLKDKRYKDRDARRKHLEKGKYATNILRVPSLKGASHEKVGHPTQKPIKLIRDLLMSSTRPGDAVLDPFLGSGTTAVACEELGRTWTGIEARADYVEMAKKRLLAETAPIELFSNLPAETSVAMT